MPFVLDASVTAAWLLQDEEHPLAISVQKRLMMEEALVPTIWWFELRNLLIVAERRRRLTASASKMLLTSLTPYPIVADNDPDEASLMQLARNYNLSIYDASYLELAKRLNVPLATLDRKLAHAAVDEHIDVAWFQD